MLDRSKLATEKRSRRSRNLDRLSTLGIVDLLAREDRLVAPAVAKERRRIAAAVDLLVEALRAGGRLFYVGAGTSGRLGVLDAAECPPTFGTPPRMVHGIIAGGRRALVRAVEGAEDCAADGARAIEKKRVSKRDVVVGIAACGVTPFVRAAVRRARRRGARTVFVTCAPEAKGLLEADVIINPRVGPEAVTGSTRLKAGTATKLVLNTLTTAAMVRLGKVYGNLMVDLRATSAKLRDRSLRIVCAMTDLARAPARRLLARAGGETKTAVVMHKRRCGAAEARRRLDAAGGMLRRALEAKGAK